VAKTTHVHPQKVGKKFKMQEITPFYLPWNKMYVHWRERENEDIDALVEEDSVAIAKLKQCGLCNLFWCLFMRAQPRLLNT
jgi:hypothetical protein